MIRLHGFDSAFGLVDPSPFVLKVDAYLRMAGLAFESVPGLENLRKAPKGKLPFIDDSGHVVADSSFIIAYLEEKYTPSLDQWLTDQQRGFARLLTKSLDENFYWCVVHSRWIRDDTWPLIKDTFFGGMPFPLKVIVPVVARRSVREVLKKHGIGRHSDAEIARIAEQSLQSLSAVLGEKPYFFGDKPCSFDAAAFGFLAQCILVTIDNPLNQQARTYANLVDFCERIQKQYYTVTPG